MTRPIPKSLEAYLREVLPGIDQSLCESGVVLNVRPISATNYIVNHSVLSVQGSTKESYFAQPWFADLYRTVKSWYFKKYGDKLMRSPKHEALGVVDMHGLLLLIGVPLVISKRNEDGTLSLTFAKEVLRGENPMDWVDKLPPLDHVSSHRRSQFVATCELVANRLRGIQNDLLAAGVNWPRPDVLRATVLRHLTKAALDATSGEKEAFSLAIWELQMACEKTMKGYLVNAGIAFPETHDLRALHKIAAADGALAESKAALAAFPSAGRVIRLRYSEDMPPSPTEFMRIYRSALSICGLYASRISHKFEFNNFVVQLRAPWLDDHSEGANEPV